MSLITGFQDIKMGMKQLDVLLAVSQPAEQMHLRNASQMPASPTSTAQHKPFVPTAPETQERLSLLVFIEWEDACLASFQTNSMGI